jgi:hypothetical protein
VKTLCADASVDFVDVKVGHCQALNLMKMKPSLTQVGEGFFIAWRDNPNAAPLVINPSSQEIAKTNSRPLRHDEAMNNPIPKSQTPAWGRPVT